MTREKPRARICKLSEERPLNGREDSEQRRKEFEKEEVLVKHFLKCWKEKNPNYHSKSAPRSEDINTREINDDIMNFFASLQKR